eukprot:TRINITY_DN48375_c0_g1_i1.p1 TRINITY_DN48375_c0_g1~~TRINITY_DN48375_c0_g1_i1.p1  ORF type:complete len:523 (-),score=90.33 TRINITY_DN48375_c0_g1_i1:64-1632(-)
MPRPSVIQGCELPDSNSQEVTDATREILSELECYINRQRDDLMMKIRKQFSESYLPQAVSKPAEEETASKGNGAGAGGDSAPDDIDGYVSPWELTDQHLHQRSRTIYFGENTEGKEAGDEQPAEKGVFAPVSRLCKKLIYTTGFDVFFGLVIISNGILVGVEVEYCAIYRVPEAPSWVMLLGDVCSILFVVELIIRLSALGGRKFFFAIEWMWNTFDFVAVVSSLLEVILVQVLPNGASFLIIARIIRIVRVVRLLRLLRFLRQLKTMVVSILNTLPSLCWSIGLMSMIIYMFAILICDGANTHVLTLQEDVEYDTSMFHYYWGTLSNTMYTLFMCMSGGIDWGKPAVYLEYVSKTYLYLFMFFQCFMLFALLNVITGFFCEQAIEMAQQDRDSVVAEQLKDKEAYTELFRDLFEEIDADSSGGINLDELEVFLHDPRLQAIFNHLNINVLNAWTVFRLLDTDGSAEVSIDEFVTGLLRIRGPAKTIDVRSVHHDIKRMQVVLSKFMNFVDRRLEEIQAGSS